jgi:hypothetical protein
MIALVTGGEPQLRGYGRASITGVLGTVVVRVVAHLVDWAIARAGTGTEQA